MKVYFFKYPACVVDALHWLASKVAHAMMQQDNVFKGKKT